MVPSKNKVATATCLFFSSVPIHRFNLANIFVSLFLKFTLDPLDFSLQLFRLGSGLLVQTLDTRDLGPFRDEIEHLVCCVIGKEVFGLLLLQDGGGIVERDAKVTPDQLGFFRRSCPPTAGLVPLVPQLQRG